MVERVVGARAPSLGQQWYMYFAADAGDNASHRIYVVENGNDDPVEGTWTFKAKLSDSLKHPLPIAGLFGQCDHNALGAAEVTESVHVLVLRNFANKFGPVLLQASNDVINVRDGEHDAAYAQRVHRYIRFSADCRWFLKLAQFKSAMAIRSPHHDYVASNAVEPDDTVNPLPLNGRLAFEFQAKFDKERNGSLEIFDNDADVVHSQ
jgi:hypothetical protein